MGVEKTRKVIIIGSGCAGLTAALYAARANLKPLVIAGVPWGGQLLITTDVENYPGFPEGILGPELIQKMRQQAETFGAEFIERNASRVDFSRRPFLVEADQEEKYLAESVIIATGASAKWLGLKSEQRLIGHGVSACATCDGPFFRGKDVAVVGGGDTAMEESLFLTKFANKVTVIHRRNKLRASKIMQDRALKNSKISFLWNSVVEEVLGNEKVEGVIVRDVETGESSRLNCQGLFIGIGHRPNTDLFKGHVELDERGYIVLKSGMTTNTSVPGVFSAGDVFDFRYRQAVTAAGSGCQAAIDAEKYLEGGEQLQQDQQQEQHSTIERLTAAKVNPPRRRARR